MTIWQFLLSAWSTLKLSCKPRDEDNRAECKPAMLERMMNPEWTERYIEAAERVAEARGGYDTERRLTRDLALDLVALADENLMPLARYVLHEVIYPHLVKNCGAKEAELMVTDSFVVRYDPADAELLQDGKPPKPDFKQHVDASLFSAQIVLSAATQVGIFGAGNDGRWADHPSADCKDVLCDVLWQSGPQQQSVSVNRSSGATFRGGGTRFTGQGQNVSFLPPLGGMLAHGGLVDHGADAVLEGQRYILVFFIDELSCADEDAAQRYRQLSRSTAMSLLRQAAKSFARSNRTFFYILCFFFAFAVFACLLFTFGTARPPSRQLFESGEPGSETSQAAKAKPARKTKTT